MGKGTGLEEQELLLRIVEIFLPTELGLSRILFRILYDFQGFIIYKNLLEFISCLLMRYFQGWKGVRKRLRGAQVQQQKK